LRTSQMIPPLSLHTPDGRTIRAWDFKQKMNLVIAFLDTDCALCADFLRQLAVRAADLREKQAIALAVFLAPPPAALTDFLPKEVIAGCDMPGHGARAYLGDDAFSAKGLVRRGVFVADRYGELFAQWPLARDKFPVVAEIFSSLDQIEMACEE
jgi:peroxiredoxin